MAGEHKKPPTEIKIGSLIGMQCPDKEHDEKWYEGRSFINIPGPYRAVIVGPPGSGKTSIILNLIAGAEKPEQFHVVWVRNSAAGEREYMPVGAKFLDGIPDTLDTDPAIIDRIPKGRRLKQVVVIDDFNEDKIAKDEVSNIKDLLRSGSSHNNISVIIGTHKAENIPTNMRMCFNLFIVFKPSNGIEGYSMARLVGVDRDTLLKLFKDHASGPHEALWFDKTGNGGSPAPLRVTKSNGDIFKIERSDV